MPLWFKKKEKKPETPPKTDEKRVEEKSEAISSLTQELDVKLPLEPFIPVPRPSGLRSFKLPPVNDAAKASPPPTSVDAAPAPAAPAPAAPAPVAAPSAAAPPPAPVAAPTSTTGPQAPDAPLGRMPPGVKTILKAAPVKSRIQVADRSELPIPKIEKTAAESADVPRTDPKALYYMLMNGLYDVVFVLNDDGHIMDCNTRTEEVFGYSSDDVWNMAIEKIVYGMNSRMFNILKKNLTNKRHILIDARCFRSSGTSFLAEVGVSTVQLTRSQNIVFAIRNVERRKNSAEELRKYRAVINTLPMPAFACDTHGRFEVMNPPVLKALGMVDEMEAQKKHFGEMLPDMVDCFQTAIRGEAVEETKEITRPDGTVSTMALRLNPMRKGEEITGVAGTIIFS